MDLYVLRHAEAESFASSDSARRLTSRGEQQAELVGRYCLRKEIAPEAILTSPFVRAAQTAKIVGERLGIEPITVPFLASGMTASTALEELRAYKNLSSVMVVGHQPDLGELISILIGLASPMAFPVRKASLTALEVHHLQPEGASLSFTLPVQQM